MKRVPILLATSLVATLLAVAVGGCNDSSKPRITRVNVSPACGVAPVEVIATAYASGGDETGDPLGGNNNLEMNWNFGDGGVGATSVAYHTYRVPGEYNVVVTATDPKGEIASASVPITILPDSLVISVSTNFPDNNPTTADVVRFDATAYTCGVDYPTVPGDAVKLAFRWEMNDPTHRVFTAAQPGFQRTPEGDNGFKFTTPGEYDVNVRITYPAWAVTRSATVHLTVTDPGAAD